MSLLFLAEKQIGETTAEKSSAPVKTSKRKVWKRCLIIALAAVCAFVILSMIASAIILTVLFPRSDTQGVTELSYSDIDSQKYPRREITFTSSGCELYGCLYGEELTEKKGLLIIVSGIGSGADRHLSEIMYFVDHGLCVYAYDGTGVGKSGGKGSKGLPQFKLDLSAAINTLKEESSLKGLPIFLYGHSAGGYAVTTVMPDFPEVVASVSISGFNSPNETMLYHAKKYAGFFADVEYPFICMQNYFLFGKNANCKAVDAINSVDTPVMLIEGSNDTAVPHEIGIIRHSEEITNPNAVYLIVDEPYRNGHSTIWLSADAAEYHYALLDAPDTPVEQIDKDLVNQADVVFLDQIMNFYMSALAYRQSK